MNRLLSLLDRSSKAAENALLMLMLAAMLGIAVWQIVARNFFSGGFVWADEFLRLTVLWVALLGSIAAARDYRHLRIDLLSRLLPESITRWISLIADLTTMLVCAILAWYSLQFVLETREYEDLAFNSQPLWWFQAILPIGFFLMTVRYLSWTLSRLLNKSVGEQAAP